MTKEEAQKLQPFDVCVAIKPQGWGERREWKNYDVLVKRVTDDGVFVLERIQSTAVLYKFEDLEKQ